MDTLTIEIGSICALKSGGPAMTVTHLEPDHAMVAWFDDDDQEHRTGFPLTCLEFLIDGCDECNNPLGHAG